MRARAAIIVMLVVLIGFILCLPLLELIDYNDLILTGQDTEISVLNLLTIFGVWFVLILRLLAFLPSFQTNLRVLFKAARDSCFLRHCKYIGILFLPDESQVSCDPFPLLI